ncbi:Mu DNA binding, I gamma subdomain [Desulfofundulus thermosubterraneus DSM 16057]|uniref:Mu DNA binding, I gamma subdomain n=1 Tax=Desulfofundulus thermosubterraneus DSM 16057 TaxID=1121432 RepID=A0A1M6KKQ0_9FIRM|nr:Mu DNA binding, I gamma subdomain [Desulfofundulus thermosubterraneus DSM 16057]
MRGTGSGLSKVAYFSGIFSGIFPLHGLKEGAELQAVWLSTSEAARALGVTERAVRKKIMAGELQARVQAGRGGLGGQVYLVPLDALPPEARRRYLAEVAAAPPSPPTPPPEPENDPNEKIGSLAELIAKYGEEKARKIVNDARAKWEAVVLEALEVMNGPWGDKARRLEALARRRKVSKTTLYRMADRYMKEGVIGLVHDRYRRPGEGTRDKSRRSVTPEVEKFIRAMYLKYPPPKKSKVYEELKKAAAAKGWPLPSRATVYRVIADIKPAEEVLATRGDKEYESKMMPKVRRTYNHLLAMEEIVGDGHPFDIFVEFNGRAVRPNLSAWMDLRSRKIVGWCVTAGPANSDTIALALRHAIITHGLPGTLYTDWGKEYINEYIKDVCRRLDIGIRNCIPRTPRSKAIERLFRTVHDQFTLYLPGYCGNTPENRPPGYDEKKLLKQGKLLKFEDFVRRWAQYVEVYNNQVHSQIKDTPANAFAAAQHVRPGRVDERDLDILMMRKERVKVQPGYIRLFGRDYWSHNVDLGMLVGEWVQVWYDPHRVGEVLIWYRGKCIGTARNEEALAHGLDRAELAERLRANRRVKKALKLKMASYVEGIEDVLPGEIVRKAKRIRRSYAGTDLDGPVEKAVDENVQRLTGGESAARQVREVLESTGEGASRAPGKGKSGAGSRSKRLLLAWGDRVLAK